MITTFDNIKPPRGAEVDVQTYVCATMWWWHVGWWKGMLENFTWLHEMYSHYSYALWKKLF